MIESDGGADIAQAGSRALKEAGHAATGKPYLLKNIDVLDECGSLLAEGEGEVGAQRDRLVSFTGPAPPQMAKRSRMGRYTPPPV